MQENRDSIELRAMIRGKIAAILSGGGVDIETNGTLIQAAWDSGHEGYGRLKTVSSSPGDWLDSEQIGTIVSGTILVAGRVDQIEVLQHIQESDAHGLIVGSMPARLCMAARSLNLPVVVTDGAGVRPMLESIFELLRQSEGREVSLLAAEKGPFTQRSEIIIPLPTAHVVPNDEDKDNILSVGKQVRILCLGHDLTTGEVVRLHYRPKQTATKSRVQGADVRRADGSVLYIPSVNIDLIVQ
jgi:hypothetical protein